jgi:hypothetical protein
MSDGACCFLLLGIPRSVQDSSFGWHCIALHCMALLYITLLYITLLYIALHCFTLHYTALHYITLLYITLHCYTLHCYTLHCFTLHCFTLHCNGISFSSCLLLIHFEMVGLLIFFTPDLHENISSLVCLSALLSQLLCTGPYN